MRESIPIKQKSSRVYLNQRGVAALEMALILPVMLVLAFVIVDFGRLIQARLVVTNLSREGASLASRDELQPAQLIQMLQSGASPINLASDGRIYIWRIRAGQTQADPFPFIDQAFSGNGGALAVASTIGSGQANLGLTSNLYNHLEFDTGQKSADIGDVAVVEVFYRYSAITPISKFVPGLFTSAGGSSIISSRAVF